MKSLFSHPLQVANVYVEIKQSEFDPWFELNQHQKQHKNQKKIGACAVFVGTMRDFNHGENVKTMTIDYYPGMAEKQLNKIVKNQISKHQLKDAYIIHRAGLILPGESIVLVATWSSHRKQAFEACREIMEDLKHTAPFWKREQTSSGTRWVDQNTPG